jgi:cytoskeleton protein RodZ
MTAADQAPNMDANDRTPYGPGGLLRAARESAGVSLRDIAAQLHLDERTIESLERDDFNNLPAPTFVRGYLRGYARLLSVPIGPVMEAYDREGFRPPDLVPDIAEAPESNATDFPISLVTWTIVLVLAALVVLWWNSNNQEFSDLIGPVSVTGTVSSPVPDNGESPTTSTPKLAANALSQAASGPTTAAPAPERTKEPMRGDAGVPLVAGPAGGSTTRDSALRAEEILAQAQEVLNQSRHALDTSPTSGSNEAPQAAQSPVSGQQRSPDNSATNTGTTSRTTQAQDSSAPLATTTNRAEQTASTDKAEVDGSSQVRTVQASSGEQAHLEMNFTAKTWVQVLDRDNKKLFYNLAKAGQNIDILGAGPLRIILGRTRGVQIRFNEKEIDIAPFVVKGVARFTLPSKQPE